MKQQAENRISNFNLCSAAVLTALIVAFFDSLFVAVRMYGLDYEISWLMAVAAVTIVIALAAFFVLWFSLSGFVLKNDDSETGRFRMASSLAAVLVAADFFYNIHSAVELSSFTTDFRAPSLLAGIIVTPIAAAFISGAAFDRLSGNSAGTMLKRACSALWVLFAIPLVCLIVKGNPVVTVISAVSAAAVFMIVAVKAARVMTVVNRLVIISVVLAAVALNFQHPLSVSDKPIVSGSKEIKHVIVVLIDTLRADAVSAINPDTRQTPCIDALAEDGTVFTDAYSSAPWTVPSVASLFTGVGPMAHKVGHQSGAGVLDYAFETMAEYFQQADYKTLAVMQNPAIWSNRFRQGFDLFLTCRDIEKAPLQQFILEKISPVRFVRDEKPFWVTDNAIEWLDINRDKKTFTYLHYIDPHAPYEPYLRDLPAGKPVSKKIGTEFADFASVRSGHLTISQTDLEWIRDLYEAEIADLDRNVGRLVDQLKRFGIYDESLIVLLSDHGEEFMEHGDLDHGQSLYNELLHVPLIIKTPRSENTGFRSNRVSINSTLPTMLDLCGIEYEPDNLEFDSLEKSLTANAPVKDADLVSLDLYYYEQRVAVIFDKYKYIEWENSDFQELYDLKNDPGEQNNIAVENPKIVLKGKKMLALEHEKAQRIRNNLNITETKQDTIDKETLEALKSLGYLK